MKYCKDCEPAQESHLVAYLSVVFGWIDEPFFKLMERLFKNTAEIISDKITLPFFNLMVFLKLGYFSEKPDKKDTWRTKCFWDEAKRRGIKMREFHLGPIRDGFVAKYADADGSLVWARPLGGDDGSFFDQASDIKIGSDGNVNITGLFAGDATTDYTNPILGAATNFVTGGSPRSVAMGDFNGDLELDLVVANFGDDQR